jgi:predicted MFS family arabinose efflux permease
MDLDNQLTDTDPAAFGRADPTPPVGVLCVAGGLALIATIIAAVVPAFMGTWQAQFGIHADQAAFVAATEFFAQVAGAGIFIAASRTFSWRQCALFGLMVVILGNFASFASMTVAALIPARALAGLGGGMLRALGMMCLARAASPGRAFALYATAQVAIAAVVTAVLPTIVATAGPRAPFAAIAAIAGLSVAVVHFLPIARPNTAPGGLGWTESWPASASWAVAGLFVYFVGQGTLWTFLQPIGRRQFIDSASITHALTLLNFAGLLGSFGVGALAHRVHPPTALMVLLGIGIISVLVLFNAHTAAAFIAASSGFYFAWCASFPFQFTLIAKADSTGAASATVPAVDTLGLASGAALAGLCVRSAGIVATGWIWAAGSIIGISLFAVAARRRRNSIACLETAPAATAV